MKVRVKVKIVAGSEERTVNVEVPQSEVETEAETETKSDTYEALLARLGINPVEVLVLSNGRPVPEDEKVASEAEIEIIRIVSGG
ncbi:MAG: MoaD/ThiS family protein [Methanophagales archaeon]|nr:MoaD/ThiS family protein [Methanophagales archaeon]